MPTYQNPLPDTDFPDPSLAFFYRTSALGSLGSREAVAKMR